MAQHIWLVIFGGLAAAFGLTFGTAEHRALTRRCHPTATDDISRIPHAVPLILAVGWGSTTAFAVHIRNHIRWRQQSCPIARTRSKR
jgi:hypothetical protein